MKITFDMNRKIEDVQRDFNNAYPYLRLEFNPLTAYARQKAKQEQANSSKTVGDLNTGYLLNNIEITDDMTVAQVEKFLGAATGQAVKILRKSGNIWMGTSITNNWSLGQQNQHASEISEGGVYLPNKAGF